MTKQDFHKLLAHTTLISFKNQPDICICVCVLQRISEQEIQIISTPEKHNTFS